MTRTIFFIATVVVAGTISMAPAANACISCEHVPVVVRGSQTNYVTPRYYADERTRARVTIGASKRLRARAAEARAEAKHWRAIAAAKARALSAARAKAKARAIANVQPTAVDTPPLPVRAKTERADVTIGEPKVVLADAKFEPAEVLSKPIDCKKFVPSAGLTITVPCE
jgi:L-asparaginase/Glu-tRNA(Gln) amidotransferase subunit D